MLTTPDFGVFLYELSNCLKHTHTQKYTLTVQGGIFHPGRDDGLCFYWHGGSQTARAHNETLILLPSISFLPSSSPLYLYSLSLSCLHSHEECRQVGLICCIGHCQSSSLSCGNRSLMISGLRLSCLCYIYFGCWAAPPLAVPSAFCVFLPLYQILTEIIGVFK